ncbi:hypothetical protein AQUCO_04400020v1 [Aquilegia coerulea]|uniref:CDC20/Fizzy WD40 domain-containing protein n=1 Tax=Aquilegia coerulea TaxID=218851 RepID=A0A2G5CML8_AQUCA|nr:hypothetical protein AQUCO_04400020v1 [Aquilegia coerulea]
MRRSDMNGYSYNRLPSPRSQYDILPGDRFIPNRSLMDMSRAQTLLSDKPVQRSPNSTFSEEYRKWIEENLTLGSDGKPYRMLVFRGTPKSGRTSVPPIDEFTKEEIQRKREEDLKLRKRIQQLPKSADRCLDAPNLKDDFYSNPIDWGKNNVLAIALGSEVYLWNAKNKKIQKLMEIDDVRDFPTSVAWSKDTKMIAVGCKSSTIQLWDVQTSKLIRSLKGHKRRVGCLAWNDRFLTSGSLDGLIINHDARVRENSTSCVRGHDSDVCGLKWSGTGKLLASGGNDNVIKLWEASNLRSDRVVHCLKDHCAAIKALAWCPHEYNILASGGGTTDRCIKMWNSHTGKCIQSIDTTSQVCALEWNRHHNEILSGHGYSNNQLSLWTYPSMSKLADIMEHTSRILWLSQSPDGLTVVSAGADQVLRLWKVFQPPDARTTEEESMYSVKRFHIR